MVITQSKSAIIDTIFREETIRVDGMRFIRCEFNNCVIQFGGVSLPYFENCRMVDTNWHFVEGAGNTIAFLQLMHNTFGRGGKELLDIIIGFIIDPNVVPGHPQIAGELHRTDEYTPSQIGRAYMAGAEARRTEHYEGPNRTISEATISMHTPDKPNE
jgi:hypothetical protein